MKIMFTIKKKTYGLELTHMESQTWKSSKFQQALSIGQLTITNWHSCAKGDEFAWEYPWAKLCFPMWCVGLWDNSRYLQIQHQNVNSKQDVQWNTQVYIIKPFLNNMTKPSPLHVLHQKASTCKYWSQPKKHYVWHGINSCKATNLKE
jgi:hypothetical protein